MSCHDGSDRHLDSLCTVCNRFSMSPARCVVVSTGSLHGKGRVDVPRRNHEHPDRHGCPHASLLHDAQGPDVPREKSKDSVRILHKSAHRLTHNWATSDTTTILNIIRYYMVGLDIVNLCPSKHVHEPHRRLPTDSIPHLRRASLRPHHNSTTRQCRALHTTERKHLRQADAA